MATMRRIPLCIQGAYAIECVRHKDSRGFFQEIFNINKYPATDDNNTGKLEDKETKEDDDDKQTAMKDRNDNDYYCPTNFQQVSQSQNVPFVFRGIHRSLYVKLVTCMSGSIMDYVIDLRPESPTFLQWCCIPVSAENQRQVLVPERCGHAFVSLDEGALVLYLQEGTFNPPNEWDFHWKDESLQIKWDGLVPDLSSLIVSAKDQKAPSVRERMESVMDVSNITNNHEERVLVIGASGQLGTSLCQLWKGSVGTRSSTGSASRAASHCYMEYNLETATDEDAQLLFEMVRPTVLIICGGFTWVDGCERDEAKAMKINCDGPVRLVKAAKKFASKTSSTMKIVFYSTDYVFDGTKDMSTKYKEDDQVNPLNAYGRSKLNGERQILEEFPSALILRTSVVYGPDPNAKNFVCQMLRHQKHQSGASTITKRTLPIDQTGCPTYVVDLAAMTKLLLEKEASGVYNLVGDECYGRFDFAEQFAPGMTEGVTTAELHLPTPRPLNGALDNRKAKEFLGDEFQIRGIHDALKDWNPQEEDFMTMRQ